MSDPEEAEQAPNELRPRDVAVALIAEKIAELRASIDAHQRYTRNPGSYYHSRIRVFLEQCVVELKRAAKYLEETDMAEEDPG